MISCPYDTGSDLDEGEAGAGSHMDMSPRDFADLQCAKSLLESPGIADKITQVFGTPLEYGFGLLPQQWSKGIQHAARKSLFRALDIAVRTLADKPNKPSANLFHKMIVSANGAASGAFGLPALVLELPLSTTVMLRSIADVARSEGESVQSIETRLACLEVFALGGRTGRSEAAEVGYFAIRAGLARAVSEAAKYIAERGLVEEGAPALVRLITLLSTRFGVVVSEKVAAQAIPLIGAAGGALINGFFIDHFQSTARGHFIIRRLERIYPAETIESLYNQL